MLHDSVLRCLISVKYRGHTADYVFDAVRENDCFLIVLEWGAPDEECPGVTPKQCVPIPASEIEFEADPSQSYEIISQMGIDLDAAKITDVESVTLKMFQPPPR